MVNVEGGQLWGAFCGSVMTPATAVNGRPHLSRGAAVGLLVGGTATVVFGSATLVGGITIAGTLAFVGSLAFVLASHSVKSDMLKWITKEMDW